MILFKKIDIRRHGRYGNPESGNICPYCGDTELFKDGGAIGLFPVRRHHADQAARKGTECGTFRPDREAGAAEIVFFLAHWIF